MKNAKKEGDYYHYLKYVKTVCGVAYSGIIWPVIIRVQEHGK